MAIWTIYYGYAYQKLFAGKRWVSLLKGLTVAFGGYLLMILTLGLVGFVVALVYVLIKGPK